VCLLATDSDQQTRRFRRRADDFSRGVLSIALATLNPKLKLLRSLVHGLDWSKHSGTILLLLLSLAHSLLWPIVSLGLGEQLPTSSIKQEQPEGESQPPRGVTDIISTEQKRIGKHEFRATGEVQVRYQDMLLKADEVWGNDLTQDVEGQGHVYFEQGQQKIWGERFKFNLRTKTGSF